MISLTEIYKFFIPKLQKCTFINSFVVTTCFCAFLKLFLFEKTKGIHSSGQFRFFNVWVKMKAVALLSKMTHISFIR